MNYRTKINIIDMVLIFTLIASSIALVRLSSCKDHKDMQGSRVWWEGYDHAIKTHNCDIKPSSRRQD
jgi:hypothetical protein